MDTSSCKEPSHVRRIPTGQNEPVCITCLENAIRGLEENGTGENSPELTGLRQRLDFVNACAAI
ncbi:MAG: hypothetical protein HGB37_02545 [Candidatus Moranbacteria bacterium]|nr:hypothetical protein [Candidatus Moranbacteria bacterium]